MKQIKDKQVHHENKKAKYIIGGVIIFIMVSSILGIIGSEGSGKIKFGDYSFKITDRGTYELKIQNVPFEFHFLPSSFTNNSFSGIEVIQGKKVVYTTSDPLSDIAQDIAETEYLLGTNLIKLGIRPIPSYTLEGVSKRPVITCLNSTPENPVIYLEQRDETAIKPFGNCLKITAKTRYEFFAVKDWIVYKLLGIL